MARKDKKRKVEPRRPAAPASIELTDEDLELVVGGLSIEAATARLDYLRGLLGTEPTPRRW